MSELNQQFANFFLHKLLLKLQSHFWHTEYCGTYYITLIFSVKSLLVKKGFPC